MRGAHFAFLVEKKKTGEYLAAKVVSFSPQCPKYFKSLPSLETVPYSSCFLLLTNSRKFLVGIARRLVFAPGRSDNCDQL